jgi:8-oxo-dGTP pyrophosphatase MutT (NUDIX family)
MTELSWQPEPESDQIIEENWLFQLCRERHRSRKSGLAHDFYVLHLLDAVSVVATTTDGRLILVRQFRAGSRLDSLETPGGLLNEGEDPLTAGARELLEETGYAGDPAVSLGTAWSNPSLMTSKITTILITNARKIAEPNLDHGEEVEVELFPQGEVLSLIRDGRVDHALVVLGLYAWLFRDLDRA